MGNEIARGDRIMAIFPRIAATCFKGGAICSFNRPRRYKEYIIDISRKYRKYIKVRGALKFVSGGQESGDSESAIIVPIRVGNQSPRVAHD